MALGYDRKLLDTWCDMETWDMFLEKNNAFANNVSTEGFKFIEQKYFTELKRRINYCENLLPQHKGSFIYYTIAQLHNRNNLDESTDNLYKRKVRFYCIKAIRLDRKYAAAWALLAGAYEWLAFLGGESSPPPQLKTLFGPDGIIIGLKGKNELGNASINYIEKSIFCLEHAINIDPENKIYRTKFRELYWQRNEEYKGK